MARTAAFFDLDRTIRRRSSKLAPAGSLRACGLIRRRDSDTDLPFLEAVGRPVAVNPDRALRRVPFPPGLWLAKRRAG